MNWDNYRHEIDEIKIDDTFNARLTQTLQQYQRPFVKQRYILRYASIALVLCLVFMYSTMSQSTTSQQKNEPLKNGSDKIAVQDEKRDLPILTYDPTIKGGMGILAFTNLSPDELERNTPWTYNNQLKKIPVYHNATIMEAFEEKIIEGGLTDAEINEKLYYYADVFQFKNFISMDRYPEDNKLFVTNTRVSNRYKEGNIKIDRLGNIRIEVHVDEDIAKQFRDTPTNKKQAEQRALQFAKLFQKELKLKHPVADVFMQYSTIYNEETQKLVVDQTSYEYNVYDKKKSVQKQIEAYSISNVNFHLTEGSNYFEDPYEGATIILSFNESVKGETVGMYPLVNAKDAEVLFYTGKYISNSPDADLNKKIASMQLVYEYRSDSAYVIPFYRIYAPVAPSNLFYPLNQGEWYGVYYVPAIPFKYLDIVDAKEAIQFYG